MSGHDILHFSVKLIGLYVFHPLFLDIIGELLITERGNKYQGQGIGNFEMCQGSFELSKETEKCQGILNFKSGKS